MAQKYLLASSWMKIFGWRSALAISAMLLFSQIPCHPENTYGEKCDERKTNKESNLFLNQQAKTPKDDLPIANPKSNTLTGWFEAMSTFGQGIVHAINNLFTIKMSEESGWKKKEYAESTNSPISTLTPVINNLQKVGSP